MSWEAVAWAMKQPVGHSPAKFVLVAIAERAGKENTAWPSVSALVEATCQNRKTVLANMQRLVEMGYLIDTGERTGQTKSVVVYRLNEPESSPKINTAKQSQNLPVAVPKDTPLSYTCFGTACEDEAVPKSTASSPKKSLKQSQKVPEAVPKSSTEPSEPPLGTTIEPPLPAKPDGFDEFWNAYPNTSRRVAKSKCHDLWKTKKLEPVAAEILTHVIAMKATKQWKDGYEPAPLTYLNQRRWEDGLPEPEASTGASRHGNFAKQDYRAGIGADGSF